MSSSLGQPHTLDVERLVAGQRAVSLVFVSDEFVKSAVLAEGQSLLVGRNASADVELPDPTVSRQHARFTLLKGQLLVEDAGSHNGVLVNGAPWSKCIIAARDNVRIGGVEVIALGADLPSEAATQQLSPAAFMTRMGEELLRSRYAQRPFWLAGLRFPGEEPFGEVTRLMARLRDIDRFCIHTPNIALLMMFELDEAEAGAALDTLLHGSGQSVSTALRRCSYGSSAEALLGSVVDDLHNRRSSTVPPQALTRVPEDEIVQGRQTQALFDLARRTSHADLPVLLLGETGVGKEVVARAFHRYSRRSSGPFCEVNCATITPSIAESLLFGHEKGAFTGADKRTAGLFEQAHGGTLFLDEVGELPLSVQSALLRALETGRIRRVGASQEISVDVRLIAATNRNLHELVARGAFREDVLYRLEALSARIPPLRERSDEIEPLARLFLRRARTKWRARAEHFSLEAMQALTAYPWPGNIRQVRNAVERAVAVCPGDTIELVHLPDAVRQNAQLESDVRPLGQTLSLPEQVRQLEIARLRDALSAARGNRAEAARLLGLPRRTLGDKLKSYSLEG